MEVLQSEIASVSQLPQGADIKIIQEESTIFFVISIR